MVQDRCQTVVFVHSRQEARCKFKTSFQRARELAQDHCRLFSDEDVCFALLQEHLPPLNQLRHFLPVHLEPILFVIFARVRRRSKLAQPCVLLPCIEHFPAHGQTFDELFPLF
jgi:hypothetical protein